MAQRQLATSPAAAIVAPNQIPFSVRAIHFRGGKQPTVAVEGLVSAETMNIFLFTNGDWEELNIIAGTPKVLTATDAVFWPPGPGTYGYIKSATVGAIVLTLDDGI